MHTIIVGYNGSETAERALSRAAQLAEALSALLVVVSVTQTTHLTVPPEPEELAAGRLERARVSLASRPVEAEYVAEVGEPAERLLDVGERRDADLIVVGNRGHGFVDRLLGRAVDEAVARRAARDVLLVH